MNIITALIVHRVTHPKRSTLASSSEPSLFTQAQE